MVGTNLTRTDSSLSNYLELIFHQDLTPTSISKSNSNNQSNRCSFQSPGKVLEFIPNIVKKEHLYPSKSSQIIYRLQNSYTIGISTIPIADIKKTFNIAQNRIRTSEPHLLHNLAPEEDVPILLVTEDYKKRWTIRVKSPEHYRLPILAQQEVCSFLGVMLQEVW